MSPTLRRTLASLTAWLVGAIVAVSVGVLALSAIGDSWASGTPRSLQANNGAVGTGQMGASSPGSVTPSPTSRHGASPHPASPTANPAGQNGATYQVQGTGGTVQVRCDGNAAYLVGWSPDNGYQTEETSQASAVGRPVRVKFKSAGGEAVLRVRCVQGIPQIDTSPSGEEGGGHD